MLDDKVCGTYWYCVKRNGTRWLTTGEKPRMENGHHKKDLKGMNWLCLDDVGFYSESINQNGYRLTSKELNGLSFPNITYEDGPLEIEIVKSGKVYWYDS